MEILLWLLPSVVMTCAAMGWVSWVARDRPERERSEAEQARFAQALMRPMPDEGRRPRQRERSTGVAPRRDPGEVTAQDAGLVTGHDTEGGGKQRQTRRTA